MSRLLGPGGAFGSNRPGHGPPSGFGSGGGGSGSGSGSGKSYGGQARYRSGGSGGGRSHLYGSAPGTLGDGASGGEHGLRGRYGGRSRRRWYILIYPTLFRTGRPIRCESTTEARAEVFPREKRRRVRWWGGGRRARYVTLDLRYL